MNVLCDGVDIGCTGVKSSPVYDQIEWVSIDGGSKSPPLGKYSVRLEFAGPVDPSMPTEGVHEFTIVFTGQKFHAEAEHIPAHKDKGSRLVAPCVLCGSDECCSAVWEDYEFDVPAKTYWNVLKETGL